jgi:prephenate dehydratase
MAKHTIGYLGPAGSFTWRAAKAFQASGGVLEDYDRVEDLFEALNDARVDSIVVPFENSEQGFVEKHVALFHDNDVFADGATTVDLNFALYRKRQSSDPITLVWGHPMALKQCAGWISSEHVEVKAASSSTRGVVELESTSDSGVAAIAPDGLDELYDVVQVQEHLEGSLRKSTRFLSLSKGGRHGPEQGRSCLVTVSDISAMAEVFRAFGDRVAYAKPFKVVPELAAYAYLVELKGCEASDWQWLDQALASGALKLKGQF